MLRGLKVTSWLGIAVPLVVFVAMYATAPTAPADRSTGEPFAAMPVDSSRTVEFDIADADLKRLSQRQLKDQLLDWLLFTMIDAGVDSTAQFDRSTFERPITRIGSMVETGELEYGDTRSAVVGDDDVIALIPRSSDTERADYLAHVSDEHRKNLGGYPANIIPIEYTLDGDALTATVNRRSTIPGEALFTPEAGYHTTTVTSAAELNAFLDQIDDLTFARMDGDVLELGGRALEAPYRGIRTEDVAAIWQAEHDLLQRLDQFEAEWQAKADTLEELAKRSGVRRSQFQIPLELLGGSNQAGRPGEYTPPATIRSSVEFDREVEKLKTAYAEARRIRGIVNGSGFSLDPAYDYQAILGSFQPLVNSLIGAPALQSGDFTSADVFAASNGLRRNDVNPLYRLINRMRRGADGSYQELGYLLEALIEANQFQAARYDGDLGGTEVGMVLFYTDLLAKLWAIDFVGATPDRLIPDFPAMVRIDLSPIYAAEVDSLRYTRLWFGHRDAGFQTDESQLLMARNATRVYAAASDPLIPGVESPNANAQSSAFLGWWNDHYEEVARYEPEYQRLNQIMKWSLLIGWLNEQSRGESIEFLADVNVVRSNWFPNWARRNRQLRFNQWNRVGFYGRSYKGTRTEALPQLQSEPYSIFGEYGHVLSGGVSLANKGLFAERVALSRSTAPALRRARLNYRNSYGTRLSLLDGTEYGFDVASSTRSIVTREPAATARFRGRSEEIARGTVSRTAARPSPARLELQARIGQNRMGSLSIDRSGNGFKVGLRGRAMAEGHEIATNLSRSESWRTTLLNEPRIEAAYDLGGNGSYLVKQRANERWLVIEPEPPGNVYLEKGWDSRVADPTANRSLRLRWLDSGEAARMLTGKDVVLRSGTRGRLFEVAEQAPVSQSRDVQFHTARGQVRARLSLEDQAVRVSFDDLPGDLRMDATAATRTIARSDINAIRDVANRTTGRIEMDLPVRDAPMVERVRTGRYTEIARDLASDPQTFVNKARQELTEAITRADDLIADGALESARAQLDQAFIAFGDRPELVIRSAMLDLRAGRTTRLVRRLNGSEPHVLSDPPGFFDEVRVRYAGPGGSGQSGNLDAVARFFEWNDRIARQGLPVDRVRVADVNGRLELQLTMADPRTAGQPARLEDAIQGNPLVYVQDSPGLNNLDWGAGTQSSLRQVVSGDLGEVIRLPRSDLATFSPASIHAADGTRQYSLAGSVRPATTAARSLARGGRSEQCDEDNRSPQCNVYVVIPAGSGR